MKESEFRNHYPEVRIQKVALQALGCAFRILDSEFWLLNNGCGVGGWTRGR